MVKIKYTDRKMPLFTRNIGVEWPGISSGKQTDWYGVC